MFYCEQRTETIRSVSEYSIEFCKNPDITRLKKAINHIESFKKDTVIGKGADRHLFGLYLAGRYLGQKFDLFENFEEMYRKLTSKS